MYETFDEWYDVFVDEIQNLGYAGPIIEDTFYADYEDDKCPYETAEEFVNEILSS